MNEEINQLEQYIFAKDRKLFLDNLIKDTESHYYFSLLDAIDNQGNSLTHEQEEDLKRYRKFRTASSKGIRVRYLFRQYDKADSEENKKKVIQELNSKLFKVTGVLPLSQQLKKDFDYGVQQIQQQASSNNRVFRMQHRRHSSQGSCSEEGSFCEENEDLHEELQIDSEAEEPQVFVEEGSSLPEDELQIVDKNSVNEIEVEEEEETLDNKKEYPSTYDDKKLDVDSVIQKYPLEKLLCYLNQDNLIRIPIKKILASKDIYQIQQYLQQVDVYALTCEELKDILLHYNNLLSKNKNQEQEVVEDFHKYTLAQLKSIATYLPDVTKNKDYIKYIFLKQFDMHHLNSLKGQARIQYLQGIFEWSKGLKQKFQSLQDQIHFEILYQGIQFDIYDHKAFLDYITNPKEQISELNEQNQKRFKLLKKSYDSFWHGVHNFESSGYSQVKVIKKYIKQHLRISKSYSVSPYDEYFQDAFLQKMLIKVRLYGGDQNVPKVSKYLQPAEINTIYTSKEVKILKSNKQVFTQNEKVQLNVQLKNIDKLYVKIFNFMPENYYLKNLAAFNEHVDLDGLNPNEEVFFDFKSENIHPCTRFVKSFDFESIQNTLKGIFIIEFFSSGIASRAIIYKGSLSYFSRNTIAGQEIVILDQEGNIQSEGRVGIWINKEFYQAKKDGRILLPYRKDSNQSVQTVLISGNFASLSNLTHLSEGYSFQCNYVYNQESFIFGNKAQVIIQPSLTINSEVADISLLKNTEITIVTITTDDVPQTTRISRKTLQNHQDIVIDFNLPAKTKQVKIEVNTKLDTMTGTEELKLTHSHNIDIAQHVNVLNHATFFLQHVDQYYILVLGKNGEPLPSYKTSVKIQHKFFQDYPESNIKLQTNEEGRIALGKLQNVISVFVQSEQTKNSYYISQKWNLERNYIKGISSLPSVFQIKEGTNVEIPLICDENSVSDRSQFALLKIVASQSDQTLQTLVSNCQLNCISYDVSKLEITPNKTLVIKGLTSGLYFLRSKFITKNFVIRVHSDCQGWKHCPQNQSATSSILIKDKLILNETSVSVEKQIRVESFKYESGKAIIQLNPQEDYSYTRIHVIAFQFFPNGLSNPYNTFDSSYNNYKVQWIDLKQTNNKYMSNRQLGDEFAYVIDRKVQTRFTGNSLEKPSLAIKRNFIQDTNMESENLASGQSHQNKRRLSLDEEEYERDLSYCSPEKECYDECDDYDNQLFARDASYCEMKEYKPKKKMASKSAAFSNRITYPQQDYRCDQTPINAHLNFLKNPCQIYSNLSPNKDGLIEFDANLQRYTAVQIILKTHTHHNVSVYNLNNLVNREVESRDLRQITNLQKGKYYSIFRNTEKIMKGQQCKIDDITSTEYSIIDSLSKVFDFQIELSRFAGTFTDQSSSKSYTEEWEFLKKWDTFSTQEKISKYNNNISHELNFFIFMKDKTFFDNIVKSHLQNKIELTLVDLFLLGKYDDLLSKYYHVELLERINPFELCLMIYSLVIKGEKQKAQKLYDCLLVLSKQNVSDKEIQKKYFEIILNKQQEKAQAIQFGKSKIQQAAPMSYTTSNLMRNNNNNNYDDDNCSESFEGSSCNDLESDDDEDYSSEEEIQQNYCEEGEYDMNYDLFNADEECKIQCEAPMKEQEYSKRDRKINKKQKNPKESYSFKPIAQQYKQQRQLFQQCAQSLKKTGQYCERHYLNQKDEHFFGKETISPYQFWCEFGLNILTTSSLSNFLSPKFLECNRSHTEMVLIISILSLPFNSPNHNQYSLQGKDQVIQAGDNLLLYTKEIKETSSELKSSLMINQRFFDPNDKFEIQGDEKFEKDAQEFIINYIYGCQVIVTNCTGGQQEIQVLTEVPEGSIPVYTIEYTKSYTQKLDSYSTKIFEFYFYFPKVGTYSIYPANVSKNGQVLCVARDSVFEVKKELAQIQLNTLDQVITQGTKEDILTFLRDKDWQDSNKQGDFKSTFNSIVSMCTDKEFYQKLLVIMREKSFFHFDIWKYSLLHLDHTSLVEFINCSIVRQKISKYISHLNCSLIKQSLNIGEWNRIYEYYPLINSRVHLLKRDSANILNIQFRRTYCHFLKYVVEKGLKNMGGVDRLVFVYYLLLQDRVETAIEQFDKINETEINTKQGSIQYDYIKAYLDFYKGYPNFKVAREIIEKYLDYPITSWRNLFYDMANQLAEYDGEDMIGEELRNLNISGDVSLKKEDKVQTEKQQTLSLRFDEKKIIIEHKNILKELTLTYYKIDLEVFFSKKPFLSNISEDFSYLQPTFTQIVSLNDEDKNQSAPTVSKFDIPEQLQSTNVYIQAISGPFLKAGVTYFSTQLKVSLFSDDAYLKITDQNNSLLSKIYVKVFSKNKSGKIDFIKDGYTDLRGRFEYLLSSSVNINDIDRLSLFIMSDDLGSLILEAKPPKRVGQFSETVELKSRNWAQKYESKVKSKK